MQIDVLRRADYVYPGSRTRMLTGKKTIDDGLEMWSIM